MCDRESCKGTMWLISPGYKMFLVAINSSASESFLWTCLTGSGMGQGHSLLSVAPDWALLRHIHCILFLTWFLFSSAKALKGFPLVIIIHILANLTNLPYNLGTREHDHKELNLPTEGDTKWILTINIRGLHKRMLEYYVTTEEIEKKNVILIFICFVCTGFCGFCIITLCSSELFCGFNKIQLWRKSRYANFPFFLKSYFVVIWLISSLLKRQWNISAISEIIQKCRKNIHFVIHKNRQSLYCTPVLTGIMLTSSVAVTAP